MSTMSSTVLKPKMLKSLPVEMLSPALIQNPIKHNKILIFSTARVWSPNPIYSYDKTSKSFDKIETDNLSSLLTDEKDTIPMMEALHGTEKDSIIVLGHLETTKREYIPFYSVFNCVSETFTTVLHNKQFNPGELSKIDVNGPNEIKVTDYNKIKNILMWDGGNQFVRYKNLMILSGIVGEYTSDTTCAKIIIYDLTDECNPTIVFTYDQSQLKRSFNYHGMVFLNDWFKNQSENAKAKNSTNDNDSKIGDNDIDNNSDDSDDDCDDDGLSILRLLLFGGYENRDFFESFCQLDISIDRINENIKVLRNIANDDEVIKLSNGVTRYLDNIGDKMNVQKLKDALKKRNNLPFYGSFGIFGSNNDLYNGRHLLIYDAFWNWEQKALNAIINFDFKKRKWSISDNLWDGEYCNSIREKGTIITNVGNKNESYLIIMGGMFLWKTHALVKLSKQVDWLIERLIWIGYLKNDHNEADAKQSKGSLTSSKLALLPKDVILHILEFLAHVFVFE